MAEKYPKGSKTKHELQPSKHSKNPGPRSPPFMEKPMHFIVTTEDGKMEINEETQEVLSQAKGTISVVAIAGKYSTGKSFMMNRLFNTNAGFRLGDTVQSETKGIWMWARPHPLNPECTLILLDTEGLLDVEKGDEVYDLKIFTLAILLSKCFVYNAVGTLDDSMIQQLNLVTELTENIKTRDGGYGEFEFSSYFPSIVILLRDFHLKMKIEGKNCTSDQYLEHALKNKLGSSKKVISYNAPRRCIREYFPDRSCFTLCKPVHQDAKLELLEKIDESELEPKFLQEAKNATDAILKKAEPIEIDGLCLNGTRFFYLAKHYVKNINDGAVPCISRAVDMLKTSECTKYQQEALQLYHDTVWNKLCGKLPVEATTLQIYLKEAHEKAVDYYIKGALWNLQYQNELLSKLNECDKQFTNENMRASEEKFKEVPQRCFKGRNTKVQEGTYFDNGRYGGGYLSCWKDTEDAKETYNSTPGKGPMAEQCLLEIFKAKKGEEDAIIQGDKALSVTRKSVEKAKQEADRQKRRAKEEEAKNQQYQKELKRKDRMHQAALQKIESDYEMWKEITSKENTKIMFGRARTKVKKNEFQASKVSEKKEQYSVPFMKEPMRFIVTTEDGKMQINEAIEHVLSQAEGPISVIAIVGKYRTGKSYIMNRFFNQNAGFDLGSTIQAKTKGIWIWARPHPLNPDSTLILLDTEGLSDVEKGNETHDLQIFSLAVLLSKCLVYNTKGTLDNCIIQQLNLVTHLVDHIKTKGGNNDEKEFSSYFPSLSILLRDFFLDIEIGGKQLTPDEYLEHALTISAATDKNAMANNAPKLCIRRYFAQRNCFTLCKPVQQDEKLKMLEKLDQKEIEPRFLEQAKCATNAILEKAKPMAIDGTYLNGTRFLLLAKHHVKSINEGAVPCISTAVDMLREKECKKYTEEALQLFHDLMWEKLCNQLPVESKTLHTAQEEAQKKAVDHYMKGALFDKNWEYQPQLLSQLKERSHQFASDNNSASRRKCDEVLLRCFEERTTKVGKGSYFGIGGGYTSYRKDTEAATKKYKSTPGKGPMADKCLIDFMEAKKGEEDTIIQGDKLLDEKERDLLKSRLETLRQEQRAKEEKAEKEDLKQQQKQQQAMLQKMMNDFKNSQHSLQQKFIQEMRKKQTEYERLIKEGQKQLAEAFKKEMDELREEKELERLEMQERIAESNKKWGIDFTFTFGPFGFSLSI